MFVVRETFRAREIGLQLIALSGQLRRRELDEQVSGAADQRLVRQVLWDAGQEMVHHGHVTLTVQHLLLSMQHDLKREKMMLGLKLSQSALEHLDFY